MKLLRVGPAGAEQPMVLAEDGSLLDLSGLTRDIDGDFLAMRLDRARSAYAAGDLPPAGTGGRIGPPVARPGRSCASA